MSACTTSGSGHLVPYIKLAPPRSTPHTLNVGPIKLTSKTNICFTGGKGVQRQNRFLYLFFFFSKGRCQSKKCNCAYFGFSGKYRKWGKERVRNACSSIFLVCVHVTNSNLRLPALIPPAALRIHPLPKPLMWRAEMSRTYKRSNRLESSNEQDKNTTPKSMSRRQQPCSCHTDIRAGLPSMLKLQEKNRLPLW